MTIIYLIKIYLIKFLTKLKNVNTDLIIFSDFRHGVFNDISIKLYCKNIKKNVIKVADSQVSNRWGNILDFKFDLLLPNEKEARFFSLGDQDGSVRTLGTKLISQSKSKNVILKLGDKGIMSFKKRSIHPRVFH